MEGSLERLDQIEADLHARAFLYDDPAVYREAIELAVEAMRSEFRQTRTVRSETG